MIINRVPQLLVKKFGSKEKINLTQIQLETGMPYTSVSAWAKGKIERYDNKALNAWCRYLACQPGDILVYEESADEKIAG